ncbi:Uu.00g118370.m01.CDS01 [Anthostomella pinea]|uniref:Uu.00g118370.m01.CDS01 n=1 Tax=Anthostomella pinea TaxID=933095 RepID=A0AAI8VGF6_9PEZI|nr:Uu.00g118370.m01.CDS01 [Anthostomella pinea]
MADTVFDVLIIGGGHAGLSAGLTLYRHMYTVLIIDSRKPRNAWPMPTHIVSGWEACQAEEFRSAGRGELEATGFVSFAESEARSVQRVNEDFEITGNHGESWRGRKLLIATGKLNVFPDIPGYADNYPEKIFHCMFTFGYEHRGSRHAGLLAEGALSSPFHAAMVVGDTKRFAEEVTVYTNGDSVLKEALAKELRHPGVKLDDRRLLCIESTERSLRLDLEGGSSDEVAFLVHQPATMVDLHLVEQIGLKLDARGDIQNSPPFFQTDIAGVFVAGDCGTPFKIIPMALFMGANAGAGIARSLAADALRRDITAQGASCELFVGYLSAEKERDAVFLDIDHACFLQPGFYLISVPSIAPHGFKDPGDELQEVSHSRAVTQAADLVWFNQLNPTPGFNQFCKVLHGGCERKISASAKDKSLVDKIEASFPFYRPLRSDRLSLEGYRTFSILCWKSDVGHIRSNQQAVPELWVLSK